MWSKNRITEMLKIPHPIIQGPFGGGFSTVKLASAVSNSGGMGSFGAHNLSPSQIASTIQAIKSKTNKPFAMNLWVSSEDSTLVDVNEAAFAAISILYKDFFEAAHIPLPIFPDKFGERFEDQIEALIEFKPPVFSFVFGVPSEAILERCRRNGILTVGAATTVDEAVAVENAGVDCVVITGFEAGGHRPSFLKPAEKSLMGLNTVLPLAREKIKIPIIAAGGISNGKGILAAKTLGADGFQLGTAFLACEESGASPLHKEIIFSERAKNTVLSKNYSGRLARFIENDFTAATEKNMTKFLPYPAQNYLLSSLKKITAEKGQVEVTPLYAGQGAPLLKHKTVTDLMNSLIQEISNKN
jgi:nitronate monooxygenase